MELWHANFATEDRFPLFPGGKADWRRALVALAALDGDDLQLFSIVDDHPHLVISGRRPEVGRFIQRVRATWSSLLHPSVGEAYYRPVESRRHLVRLVSYFLRQPEIHALGVHNALWEGSCFSDLVGARVLPGLRLGIRKLVPRLSRDDIFRYAGLPGIVQPASLELIAKQGVERLVAAAHAALAVDDPARKVPRVRLARRALVAIAKKVGFDRHALAASIGCSDRALRRSAEAPADEVLRAVLLRLAITAAVESQREVVGLGDGAPRQRGLGRAPVARF